MAGKHEGLNNEINRGSTEKRQDAILMTSSHRKKCLWPGLKICAVEDSRANVLKIRCS